MSTTRRNAAAWGVSETYLDATGRTVRVARATVELLLDALGAETVTPPDDGPLVVSVGTAVPLPEPGEVVLEDGTRLDASTLIPPDLPLWYHSIQSLAGIRSRSVIVAPARCHLPTGLHRAGVAVQLYAARSHAGWGIGDLADLRSLGTWAAAHGAGFLLLNPLHAPSPGVPTEPSPYSPSSRRWRSPLTLRVEELPGAGSHASEIADLRAAAQAANSGRRIDRDAILPLIVRAAEICAATPAASDSAALAQFRANAGASLRDFAVHAAVAEVHGADWRRWPAELQHPGGPAVRREAHRLRHRVDLHAWIQMQLDVQLAAASSPLALIHDLAIGVDPGGSDAWVDQATLASGVHVGAPPDEFNTLGQDWGLPPSNPWALRAAGHRPFASAVRSGMRHAAGLRFDHVLGLFRLWWIPPGCGPADGGYVQYPAQEMLSVLALESVRAAAFVVGEDLGTVAPGVREALEAHDVLSYRLLWFEDEPPARWPVRALATVTTHDLPTIAGQWSGSDLEAQRAIGLQPDPTAAARVTARARAVPGVGAQAGPDTVVRALHTALAASPCMLVSATLDDLLLVAERPNMPGTVDEWPNWRLALPRLIEDFIDDADVTGRLEALTRRPRPAVPSSTAPVENRG